MATLGDIESALGVIAFGYVGTRSRPDPEGFAAAYRSEEGRRLVAERVTLLQCTTEYPAPDDDIHLKAMDAMTAAFGLPVGFSDHSDGIAVTIAAVARGATIIEKHLTLDRSLPGPDHKASLEPDEFAHLVRSTRRVERALGRAFKAPASSEVKNMVVARKSLVASRRIAKGELFTAANVGVKRCGGGISPMRYWDVVDHVSRRDFEPDEPLD
jgi:N-acetylneuraminate synthase